MDAFAFLDAPGRSKPRPVYVLAGDEAFLKRQVRTALDQLLLDDADPAFAGSAMGVVDQELAKLAVYVGDAKAVTREDVDRLVGRSRNAETFRIFDAIGAGQPGDALALLERLFDQGEEPLQLLGAFSWQLR